MDSIGGTEWQRPLQSGTWSLLTSIPHLHDSPVSWAPPLYAHQLLTPAFVGGSDFIPGTSTAYPQEWQWAGSEITF